MTKSDTCAAAGGAGCIIGVAVPTKKAVPIKNLTTQPVGGNSIMRVLFKSTLSMLAAICGVFALALLVYAVTKLMPVFMGNDAGIQPLTI